MSSLTRRKFLSTLAATSVAATLLPSCNGIASAYNNKTHQVMIKNFKFVPAILKVEIGDKIVWKNLDVAPHTATAMNKSWTTNTLEKGDQHEIIISEDMTLDYYCRFHPMMKATLKLRM